MAKSNLLKRRKQKQSKEQVELVECQMILNLPEGQAKEILGAIQTLLNNIEFEDVFLLSKLAKDPLNKKIALAHLRKQYGGK
ncbi:MAG: hypothetical protein AAFQ92_21450 [Bacteroidota bacterium]